MALTELQRPTKADFYSNLQNTATQMSTLMDQWQHISNFIENTTAADLDAMGVPTGQVRTDMVNFRTVLDEMIGFYKGTSTTQTETPIDAIAVIRKMK